MSNQTACAFVRTFLWPASLIKDLLSEGCDFVVKSRFQSDPAEKLYGQNRQMSGFIYSFIHLWATLYENILKIKSLLNKGIDIDKNVKTTNQGDMEILEHLFHDVGILNCTVDTISLSKNGRQVTVHIAGYVAKKLKRKRMRKGCSNFATEKFVSDKNPDLPYFIKGGLENSI